MVVPCLVKHVHQGEDYCNVDLETLADMPPNGGKSFISAVNTRQLLRANPGDDIDVLAFL